VCLSFGEEKVSHLQAPGAPGFGQKLKSEGVCVHELLCTTFCRVVLAYWLYMCIYTCINIYIYIYMIFTTGMLLWVHLSRAKEWGEAKVFRFIQIRRWHDRSFEDKNTKKNTDARASRWNRSHTPEEDPMFWCIFAIWPHFIGSDTQLEQPSLSNWWGTSMTLSYYALVMGAWEENWGVVNFVDSCVVLHASVLSFDT
jgi:hypothetical protein